MDGYDGELWTLGIHLDIYVYQHNLNIEWTWGMWADCGNVNSPGAV